MSIQDQEILITQLIKEDNTISIKEYLEVKEEIEGIRDRQKKVEQTQISLLMAADKLEDKMRLQQRRGILRRTYQDRINDQMRDRIA